MYIRKESLIEVLKIFVPIEIYMPHCEYDSYKELSYTVLFIQ
jgi:hypothetical protein